MRPLHVLFTTAEPTNVPTNRLVSNLERGTGGVCSGSPGYSLTEQRLVTPSPAPQPRHRPHQWIDSLGCLPLDSASQGLNLPFVSDKAHLSTFLSTEPNITHVCRVTISSQESQRRQLFFHSLKAFHELKLFYT